MPPTKRKSRAKPPEQHQRAGRPSPIDTIIGHHPDTGEPITVADRIVNALQVGTYFEHATAGAGIRKETAYEWLRVAGRLRLRARGAPITNLDPKPTGHELRCLAFSDAVDEAMGVLAIASMTLVERLARGGIPQVTVTEKVDAAGVLIERTTRTEHTLPSERALLWRLERRFPALYGNRVEVTAHVDGVVVQSVEERADELAGALDVYLQGVEAGKVTTDG